MDRSRKRELRNLNVKAWQDDGDALLANSNLDSSLKKNTAFIKRLRTAITPASVNTFAQEIRSLSLSKYLSEIISASFEGISKLKTPADISAGVEVISALHQRFGPSEYTCYLGWHLGRSLTSPDRVLLKQLAPEIREKEEKERVSRQRMLLRVATELWLVDVVRSLEDIKRPDDAAAKTKESGKAADSSARTRGGNQAPKDSTLVAEPFPLEVLKDLLGLDKDLSNVLLAVQFVKVFAWDVLGIKFTTEEQKSVDADGVATSTTSTAEPDENSGSSSPQSQIGDQSLTTPELRQRFKNILEKYVEDVKSYLVKAQNTIAAQQRRNAEVYVKSGEVFEDRQANFEKQVKAQEKLVANAQTLCDALGLEMPDLREKDVAEATGGTSIGLVKTGEYLRGQGEGAGIWEDEEERRFYENIIDVKDRVPGILLEDSKKKKQDNDEQVGKRVDAAPEAAVKEADNKAAAEQAADEQSTVIANKTVGAQVDALLSRLLEMQGKDAVDQAAVDFCFLNSKASRNRLIKAMQDVPKGRSDLFALFARLVATLGKYLPDISSGLVSHLDDEFRSLQRRKQKDFLGSVRTGNIRYLAELTKFGVVPEHVIFHCLKVSMDDFSRMNIEIISNLLENCGRYLLRNPSTSPRMKSFLETLQRKKAAQHLGQQERMLIDNAMYFVNPPERSAIQQKERTPVDLFVRKLIYLDMNKRTYTKVLKSIRKLHWEEKEVVTILSKIFSKPGKVKYNNIHFLALLVASLNRYHQDFVVSVIDDLLEHMTLGLEQNDFRQNQRRLAEVKYLGELYNYKMVDSTVIFDTLYRIVAFGHPGGTPSAGRLTPLDMPDDYFRIRLVCNMLDTCGVCFDRGAAKKKLDFFLTFFQYYVSTKDPLPMDIDFVIHDTYAAIRPQWKLLTNLEEAGSAFATAVAQNYKTQEAEKAPEPEEPEDDGSSDGGEDDVPRVAEVDDRPSSSDEVEAEDSATLNTKVDSDEEEQIVVTRQEEERDPEADAEFDRELAKMMSESLEARKFERKPMFDVPLPMRRVQRDGSLAAEDSPIEGPTPPQKKMAFALMTKKGNRQQTRTIELPSDSYFAVAMKTQQEAARAEQQRIKDLVLNYDLQDSGDQDGIPKNPYAQYFSHTNPNLRTKLKSPKNQPPQHHPNPSIFTHAAPYIALGGGEKHSTSHHQPNASLHQSSTTHNAPAKVSADKAGGNRSKQRAKKLELSDVDWYAMKKLEKPDEPSTKDRGQKAP